MMTSTILQDEARDANARQPWSEANARGVVVTYPMGHAALPDGHMAATRNELARHLAALTGFAYGGDYDALRHGDKRTYLVPSETMTTEIAARAGVRRESDLFGGVVPHPFVATKTITHPLVDVRSVAPIGWCAEFPRRVADVVLKGYSAFAAEDALAAGRKLLEHGKVRVKPGAGIADAGAGTRS